MRIAILGATSQIAKDLIQSYARQSAHELVLFARRVGVLRRWLEDMGLSNRYPVADFSGFGLDGQFDAVINCVGVGNPAKAVAMGASIFEVTLEYDELALAYVRRHPRCRYFFLSSGAAYGSSFEMPVDANAKAVVAINKLQPQDWYAVAKLHAECRHRSLAHLPIVDLRVFSYFSRTQDPAARFLITDIMRAIRSETVLEVSPEFIMRDYIHPSDFYNLVAAILASPLGNAAVDCYSKSPVDKSTLLATMQREFGLRYVLAETAAVINATGLKPHYYSLNTRAADFGFAPSLTSMEGILIEAHALLSCP